MGGNSSLSSVPGQAEGVGAGCYVNKRVVNQDLKRMRYFARPDPKPVSDPDRPLVYEIPGE